MTSSIDARYSSICSGPGNDSNVRRSGTTRWRSKAKTEGARHRNLWECGGRCSQRRSNSGIGRGSWAGLYAAGCGIRSRTLRFSELIHSSVCA